MSLGGIATIRLHHPDRAAGERLLERVVAEARRLEAIFSLYQAESVLCELNRSGVLVAPPAELVDLLRHCDRVWQLTDGVFDPTVQSLWLCYAEHFSKQEVLTEPPPPQVLEAALDLVGWPMIRFDQNRVVFERRGVKLTFNGVAQGYITDRVVDLLREAGLDSCLVDMGEIRTIGVRPDGKSWQAALRGPSEKPRKLDTIDVVNKAVASSAACGFQFDRAGVCNHLFNPTTGRCADRARALSVVADTASFADALSTAFALMEERHIAAVLTKVPGTQVFISTDQGTRQMTLARG
jgi:thiamine biosynthesis lipoprotein